MTDQISTLQAVIRYWAENTPDKQAFIFINKFGHYYTLTARDVYILAGRFATRLRKCGFVSGDVIANGLPNSPEKVITDFGIVMAGCISLNCEIIEKDGGDFWNTANVSQCKGVIFSDRLDSPTYQLFSPFLMENSERIAGYRNISIHAAPLLTKAFIIFRSPTRSRKIPTGEDNSFESYNTNGQDDDTLDTATSINNNDEAFLASLTESHEDIFVSECSPDEDVFIFTTSGSTGPCKLVPRTHNELLRMARGYKNDVESTYFNDRKTSLLGGFPFDYLRSCLPRLLQDSLDGQQAQNVRELWTILEREHCDGAFLAPSDVIDLIKEFEYRPPDFKLKFMTTAGASLKQNAMAALGTVTQSIINMYASTETGIITLLSVNNASQFKDCACGRPPAGVQIRVVGDDMEDVPQGTEGNVLVKSVNMFRHYYNMAPQDPVFTPDGWFMIRDRGVIDANGVLSVTGRQGDVVSQGIVVIYLSWPEAVLSKCPDVRDVAVVGVKDFNGDDVICACVVAKEGSGLTEERLINYYNENFMISLAKSILKPQINVMIFYDTLPLNSMGKLDKRKLRTDALKKLEHKK